MNGLYKIIGVAIVGGVTAMTVRKYNETFGMITALAVGVFIFVSLLDFMNGIVSEINVLIQGTGIKEEYIKAVVKVLGITYITQFAAEMLRDGGESAVAAKCELAGKIFILYLTMPVISEFLHMCIDVAEGI